MLWCAQPVTAAPKLPAFDSVAQTRAIIRETAPAVTTVVAAALSLLAPQAAVLAAPLFFYGQRCLLRNQLVRPKNHLNTRVKLLDHKNVVITGATSGIGRQVAIRLALLGANVTCISRHNGRQDFEDEYILPWTGGDPWKRSYLMQQFRFLHADFNSLDTVRRVAAEVNNSPWADPEHRQGKGGLHMLINCAGVFHASGEVRRGEDGIEEQTLVNALAPFLLTELLAPTVAVARDDAGFIGGRIINVSSVAHVAVPTAERCEELMSFTTGSGTADRPLPAKVPSNMDLYGFSKLVNILHADSLAQRGVCAVSVSPGGVATNIYRTSMPSINGALYWPAVATVLKTPYEGSETVFGCALRDDLQPGGFYHDNELANGWRSRLACDQELQDKVVRWAAAQTSLTDAASVEPEAWEALLPHQKMFTRGGTTTALSANKRRPAVVPQF